MKSIRHLALLSFLIVLSVPYAWSAPAPADEYFVYFGTYTGFTYMKEGLPAGGSHSKGIYVSRFQPATGAVSKPELAAEIVNPAFLAVHPNQQFLYVATEDPLSLGPDFDHASYVSAFAIDPKTGKLHLLNTLPTGGTSTCYLSIDKTGHYVLMANFGSSSVTVLRINDDGSLGEQTAFMKHVGKGKDPSFQSQAHPHSIDVSPDNRFAIVSDLGVDKLFIYRFDAATGALSPDNPPFVAAEPGGGPRHFVFDAAGKVRLFAQRDERVCDRDGMGLLEWQFYKSAGRKNAGIRFHRLQRQRRNRDSSQRKISVRIQSPVPRPQPVGTGYHRRVLDRSR